MNREIKFRGKRLDSGKWAIGYFFKHEDGTPSIFIPGEGSFVIEEGSDCQYTGLKDKNGKEIYEGDVVKINHRNFTYEIRFEDTKFMAYNIDKIKAKWGDLSRFSELNFDIDVIGNIYENPELLSK